MVVNLFVFFVGTIFGSFLNVCIHRLPKELSIVFPPSHCPKCGKPIHPTDNIPLISYLLLRGKCRNCKEKISVRYPLVEFITGLAFLAGYLKDPSLFSFPFVLVFLSLLIIAFFSDLEEQIIPDEVVIIGLVSGLVFNAARGMLFQSLIGAATGFAVFFLIAKIAGFFAKKEALGFGDLKLAAMLGAFLGVVGFWETFVLAYLLGAAISVFLLAVKIKKMGDYIPFGPFLILGAAISFFWGPIFCLAVF